jgi:hypothetical protein
VTVDAGSEGYLLTCDSIPVPGFDSMQQDGIYAGGESRGLGTKRAPGTDGWIVSAKRERDLNHRLRALF